MEGEEKKTHASHEHHHEHKSSENRIMKEMKKSPWMFVSIGLAIALVISMVGFGGISKSKAGDVVLDYANAQTGGGVSLVSVGEKYGLYEVLLFYDGENVPLYISKKGDVIISGVSPVEGTTGSNNNPGGSLPSGGSGPNAADLIDDDAIKGDPNAPVTIVEWSDYECPFCGRFFSQTLPQIQQLYIDTGKVKLVYRDFPLSFHAQAQKAAEAAECAGEEGDEAYYKMHDLLFTNGVAGGVATFKGYAAQLGLNQANFDNCLDSGAMAAEVAKDTQEGQAAGVTGTPGFKVGTQLVSGAQPFSVFQQAIEAELAKSA